MRSGPHRSSRRILAPVPAEYEALVAGMIRWGGGIPIPEDRLRDGDWSAALTAARVVPLKPTAYNTESVSVIALR